MSAISIHRLRGAIAVCISLSASACLCVAAGAQGVLPVSSASAATSSTATALPELAPLPDAPGGAVTSGLVLPTPQASPTQKHIAPGQVAPILTANDKILLGARGAFSPSSVASWFIVAGYEHVTNGSPNYGTDRGAFGRRLGDAVIRDTSEDILSDSVMSSLFREDPRYYRLGPSHNFFARLVYAGTRPLITRSDSGHASLNLALLSGTLGGSALTNLYYPQANRGAVQTLETFDGSIAASALGDIVSEFYGDLMQRIHPQTH